MTEQDMEIQSLRRELADMSHLLELAKRDLKHMAMYDMHGPLCKNWNVCYYKCSNDCPNWEWRYDNVS